MTQQEKYQEYLVRYANYRGITVGEASTHAVCIAVKESYIP